MASFSLPPLRYGYESLAPYVDGKTMNVHHTGHHAAYVNNLNNVVKEFNATQVTEISLESLQGQINSLPENIRTVVRNNGGGHYNHTFFWEIMAPPASTSSEPTGELKKAIDAAFGDVQQMKAAFNKSAAARFGSGWAWLCLDQSGNLFITSTPNQDNPLMKGIVDKLGVPIIGLDVWEHAYYLQYQNKRADYINAFWNVVNWDQALQNFETAKSSIANL
eukprot:c12314_g1_i1.p1 GENE.c12314_g1_i1~~c12314_g1_i1.p1  ORF type:complete len:241 (-),score=84.68 c12314_g1_i1:133-792(-)